MTCHDSHRPRFASQNGRNIAHPGFAKDAARPGLDLEGNQGALELISFDVAAAWVRQHRAAGAAICQPDFEFKIAL